MSKYSIKLECAHPNIPSTKKYTYTYIQFTIFKGSKGFQYRWAIFFLAFTVEKSPSQSDAWKDKNLYESMP